MMFEKVFLAAAVTVLVGPVAFAQDGTADAAELAVASPTIDPIAEALAPLRSSAAWRRNEVAVQVVRLSDGAEVFGDRADRLLVPASTTKIVTAAAALDALGPSYAFTTEVWIDGTVEGGVLDGDLILKGGGDPTLVTERLWKLVGDLYRDGITQIDGDVIFDESAFTTDYLIPGWDKPRDLESGPSYFPSIGAFGMDFGAAVLVVRPGGEPGKPALVVPEAPYGRGVSVVNELATGAPGSRRKVEVEREVSGSNVTFTLTGSVPADAEAFRLRRAVPDPTALFIGVFDALRRDRGIKVMGRYRRGETPSSATRHRVLYSPPLASILMDTNKYSSNFMAETVLRALGRGAQGEGSTAAGLDAVRSYLERLGIPRDAYTLANGSGLSRKTKLSPAQLTTVLRDMAANRSVGHEFTASLSISGTDGTLLRRLRDAPGKVRGKTGTLDGVHCLAGYLEAEDGERYAFAFLVNGVRGSLYPVKQLHDDFLRAWFSLGVVTPEGSP